MSRPITIFRPALCPAISLLLGLALDSGAQTPQIYEEFDGWTGVTSPDGLWRRAGEWTGTGGNLLTLANSVVTSTHEGEPGGYLELTVSANELVGGEIQTVGAAGSSLGYGYYEVRMKTTDVPGVCVSFFWKEVDYGPGEIDIEFLTNEPWISSAESGQVHYTIHPDWAANGTVHTQDLGFNPSHDFHRYGWLWTPQKIEYTVDGVSVKTFTNPPSENIVNTEGGYIMMNAWTGNANWGGGPPTEDAVSYYDWVKFWPGATSIPEEVSVAAPDTRRSPVGFPPSCRRGTSGGSVCDLRGRTAATTEARGGVYLVKTPDNRLLRRVAFIR
jgi:beta-glucanase (GH16 family)